MTPQLAPEQHRRIDALVAECMGFNVVATEWLCLSGYGRPTEAYLIPDYNEPPWFIYVRGRPSSAETIRPVFVPKDGQWPPVKVKPVGKDEEIWYADVQVVPQYSTNHNDWAIVERWMVDYATEVVQRYYVYALELRTGHMIFNMLTSPLHVRCLAFLGAMGKDVEEILREKDGQQNS